MVKMCCTRFRIFLFLYCLCFRLQVAEAVALQSNARCRYLPGDTNWPSSADWHSLNTTIGGALLRGTPLAQPCYTEGFDSATCANIRSEWTTLDPYLNDPINVMSPYWLNNSCSPFHNSSLPGTCAQGNLAVYAINVTNAQSAVSGIQFARDRNLRLTIKNTGHDFLGRSTGEGSLALWTANLKEITLLNYSSTLYKGPALRVGAGVQVYELYKAADMYGLRAVGGSCPTVGIAGGFVQGGGHGPLGSSYGLGSDQALEFEVVTPTGKHLIVSPTQNRDLFWALSGGGAGNYAVVLSVTLKAYRDGPVAGASLGYITNNTDAHWTAVSAWLKHLLVLDKIPGFNSLWALNSNEFLLEYATLPGGSADDMTNALAQFLQTLKTLNLSLIINETKVSPSFKAHYDTFATQSYDTNNSVGGRLIPNSVVQNNLPALLSTFRDIVDSPSLRGALISGITNNVSYARTGTTPGSNAVLPAWRKSLFHMTVGIPLAPNATRATLSSSQAWLNSKQNELRAITSGSGTYENEATYDNPQWKSDYFGVNYPALRRIKAKYDTQGLLWSEAAVGSEDWVLTQGGRLCRAA